jgi:hypothetical protein
MLLVKHSPMVLAISRRDFTKSVNRYYTASRSRQRCQESSEPFLRTGHAWSMHLYP